MADLQQRRFILLISVHGLIRGHDLELGRDADTGGQTKYVIDLARSLAEHPDVERVDLVTRRVEDEAVSEDYAQPIESLGERCDIVRIDGGPAAYIAKEQLWDHLDSFTDNLIEWLHRQDRLPDVVHSHYADAGYVGVRVANLLGIPLVHTGHSLGRDKRKRLLARGVSRESIETTYNMSRRIDAEEEILANADRVITSTHNEVEQQYGLYNYYDPSRMRVIPPGTDLEQFHPPTPDEVISFERQLEVSQMFGQPVENLAHAAQVFTANPVFSTCAVRNVMEHALLVDSAVDVDERLLTRIADAARARNADPLLIDLVIATLTDPLVIDSVAASLRGEP